MRDLAPLGVLIGWRRIAEGDEGALNRGEISATNLSVRRASGAVRIVARELLRAPDLAIPKGEGGEPIWPRMVVGSLAHDDEIAIAATANAEDYEAIGIDIERAEPLVAETFALVVTDRERAMIGDDAMKATLLFAVKEAVYKAAYPLDRVFLEFADIEVDLDQGVAATKPGRSLTVRYATTLSHVVALAYA
nr:4'-phosphopantetheinyl transferase superfamily protein [Variibacter gotjawalensis]